MKLSLATGSPAGLRCDILLVPVFDADFKSAKSRQKIVARLDGALKGRLLKTASEEEFAGKADQTFVFLTHGKLRAARLALLGLGPRKKFDAEVLRLAIGRGIKTAQKVSARTVGVTLVETRELAPCVKAAAEGLLLGAYKFDRYKTKSDGKKKAGPGEARLFLPGDAKKTPELQQALDLGAEVAAATNWARDLVNEPANTLTPTALAGLARQMAREGGLKIDVLDKAAIEKLKMGMFLGVAQGSIQPPALVHLRWEPAGKPPAKSTLAFVGKAITYDSGGLSLKPTDSMVDMKTDMAGAAAVLGAMRVVARLKPPFPVHAYLGACENMPGGRAYKPGDVLTSRLGKTVEITNTDAEGRLVLGDVLSWAAEAKPAALVDLATLTGACVVALGNYIVGAFGTDDATTWQVLEAAKVAGEEMWRLPISDHQKDALKSDIADMKNSGERWAGAINAAVFLKEFVGETPWVHLDIAGPATSPKDRGYLGKGATGVGVRTLVELVRARMAEPASA